MMKRVRLFPVLATVLALLALLAVAPAIALADATISGTLTDGNTGETLGMRDLALYTQSGGVWNAQPTYGATTDFDGLYRFTVPAGKYQLGVHSTATYADWWWSGGGSDRLTASTLTLADGDDVTIDVPLALEPVIVGGFTHDMDGVAVPGIKVDILKASDGSLIGTGTSGPDGTYKVSMDGLFAGAFNYVLLVKVRFSDPLGRYATQYYQGVTTLADAQAIGATPGSGADDEDSWLAAAQPGEVRGITLNAAGAAVPGITVDLTYTYGNVIATTTSDASGHYDFTNVPVAYASERNVSFSDPGGTYKPQTISGVTVPPGSPVTVDSALLAVHPNMPAGEGTWTWENPRPQGNDLNAISAPDFSDMWAVGAAGAIAVSNDGGFTWRTQKSGSQNDLEGVSFPDATHGWAVGTQGTVLVTADGGFHWTAQASGTTNDLYAVHFIDDSRGWAVGWSGTILTTANGGATWTSQASGTVYALLGISFADADHGCIVGAYGKVLTTTNGGATWAAQSSGTNEWITGVTMVDATRGWACTDGGHILVTTTGGASWSVQATWTGHEYTSVAASDANHCWVADTSGDISYTTDGGVHWFGDLQSSYPITAIACPTARRGFAVGAAGTILFTGDGVNWSPMNSALQAFAFEAVSFADAQNGLALGDRVQIFRTTNGGATWQPSTSPGGRFEAICRLDADRAWVAGDSGLIDGSTDGGATWQSETTGTTTSLYGITFHDTTHGWAVGAGGAILATTNGGVTWVPQTSNTTQDLDAVAFADDDSGVASGHNGTIVTTSDGGTTWHVRASGTTEELYAVSSPDANHAWAVGGSGAIVATTDGGATWKPQNAGSLNMGVSFCNDDDGWIAGASGVLATTDGGADWVPQITHSQYEFFAVSAVDPTHCWAVGDGGTIMGLSMVPPDTTAPVTTCTGADSLWHRTAVTLTLSASDETGGSGMSGGQARTEYRIDDGAWTPGLSVPIAAPAGTHANDGVHTVDYRSTDAAGNLETPCSVTVKIDTLGPVTAGKAAAGKKGHVVKLYYCVTDKLSPQATSVMLVVRNGHGKVVKRFDLGTRTSKRWYTASWKARTAGVYRYTVTAKDLAGNAQSHISGAKVTIR